MQFESIGMALDIGTIVAAVWAFSALRTEVTALKESITGQSKYMQKIGTSLGTVVTDVAMCKQALRDNTEADI